MIKLRKPILLPDLMALVIAGTANASRWQDQLSSTASDLINSHTGRGNDLTRGSITRRLNGGHNALSSNSISNVTGVLEYCVKNHLVENPVSSVTGQLKSTLGLSDKTQQQNSYQQGIEGLLNTSKNQKIDLNRLGETEMGKQLKTKACNLVLNQAKQYIGW